MSNNINIGNYVINRHSKPFIIAEAASNFNQDLDTARDLIAIAKKAGADAVKFQLFKSETLYPEKGEMYEIFKSIELDASWVPILNEYAQKLGMLFLASAFDFESVDVLESIDVPAYKIASSETTNHPLLAYIASKGKPLLISTGMCDIVDVEEALNICAVSKNHQICLLQCGSQYPLPVELTNLNVIKTFLSRFNCPVGFSDHTLGTIQSIAAVGLGSTVFEKHFTISRASEGPDHFYALEPEELKKYVSDINETFNSLGSKEKKMLESEKEFGRREGLYFSEFMKKGDSLSENVVVSKRPAKGIRSRYLKSIINATVRHDVNKGDPVFWDDVEFY